jgi:hypothetical protein
MAVITVYKLVMLHLFYNFPSPTLKVSTNIMVHCISSGPCTQLNLKYKTLETKYLGYPYM